MILDVVNIFSQLIRAAFIPHTLDRHSPHRVQFGLWPTFNSTLSEQGIFLLFFLLLLIHFPFNILKNFKQALDRGLFYAFVLFAPVMLKYFYFIFLLRS